MGELPVNYASVEPTRRIALWEGHLYRGTVTLLAGPGGKGKGLIGIHAAATVVRGSAFPGEDPRITHSVGSVVGVWPEDDPNEDIAWRLSGALDGYGLTEEEKGHVYDLTEISESESFRLDDPASINAMRAVVSELEDTDHPCRLIVIDPALAVCDTLTTNKGARKALGPLMRLARETGVAVLLIHHTIKDGKTIAGSKGLVDVLRLVMTVAPSDSNPDVIMLRVDKSNNIGSVPTLAYGVTGTDDKPYLLWNRSCARSADAPSRGTVPSWHAEKLHVA